MPNKSSKKGHIATRTCVICRQKALQTELLAFCLLPSGIVYDYKRRLPGRKSYVCPADSCLNGLSKWQKKKRKSWGN